MPKDTRQALQEWAKKPLNPNKRYNFNVTVSGGEIGGESVLEVTIKASNISYVEYVGWQGLFQQPLVTLHEAATERIEQNVAQAKA